MKRAWVTLVMQNPSYVGGALVLAHSLRAAGTTADLVCLVTPDIAAPARALLARAFTRVVVVEPLRAKALQRTTSRECFAGMYHWLDDCFTKFHVFNLTNYDKVVFLDADMLAAERPSNAAAGAASPDDLFDLPAPAGICSSVKDGPANSTWHGCKLPGEQVARSVARDYGIRGCCLVLTPDPARFEEAKAALAGGSYGSTDNIIGPDELLMTNMFEGQWTHVHAKFGSTAWHAEKLGAPAVILHYVSEKPWAPKQDWPDFQFWWAAAAEVLALYPESSTYFGECLERVQALLKTTSGASVGTGPQRPAAADPEALPGRGAKRSAGAAFDSTPPAPERKAGWKGRLSVVSEKQSTERVCDLECEAPAIFMPRVGLMVKDYVPAHHDRVQVLPSFALRLCTVGARDSDPEKYVNFLKYLAGFRGPTMPRSSAKAAHISVPADKSNLACSFYLALQADVADITSDTPLVCYYSGGRTWVAPPPQVAAPAPGPSAMPAGGGRRAGVSADAAAEESIRLGSARYAYVFTVLKGDSYVPGALVAAYSLRRCGSVADLVCLVTPDVSEAARARLRCVFNSVREIDYLRVAVVGMRTAKQDVKYSEWMDVSFSRWACLALVEYEKVLLLDADVLALSNLDELFQRTAPAAMFSTPWAEPYKARGGIHNPYVGPDGWPLADGAMVSSAMVAAALKHPNSFVAIANCVLLAPEPGAWAAFKSYVAARQPFGLANVNSGKDEQSLAMFFTETRPTQSWRHIHQKFGFIPWHKDWLPEGEADVRAYHYFGNKPWEIHRTEWPDLEKWYLVAEQLETAYPPLRGHLHVTGAISK